MPELEELREDDPADLSFFDEDVPRLNADEAIGYINERANKGRRVDEKVNVIKRAGESCSPFLLRRPFGIVSVDIAIAGGLPAGGVSQIGGPDGIGKDALAALNLSTSQAVYGRKSRLAVCTFETSLDKQHYRNQGVIIPDSEDDLMMENARRISEGRDPLTEEETTMRKRTLGEFFVIDSGTAEDRLQAVLDLIAQNLCQVIVVDSIAAIATKHRMNVPLGKDARQADRAGILTEWMRMAQCFFSQPLRGRLNLTTVIITNQVRANQNPPTGPAAKFAPKYIDSAPRAIKHGKLISLDLKPGEKIPKTGKQRGKMVKWKVTKAKAGSHEGFSGELAYYFDTGFDGYTDLFITARNLGLIQHKERSATCEVVDCEGEVHELPWGANGAKVVDALYTDPDLYWSIYDACLRQTEVSCLRRL
jgi:RecA/RadA recombinase